MGLTEGPRTDAERPGVDKEDKRIHRGLRYAQRSPKQARPLIIQAREFTPEDLQGEGFWYRMHLMGMGGTTRQRSLLPTCISFIRMLMGSIGRRPLGKWVWLKMNSRNKQASGPDHRSLVKRPTESVNGATIQA